MTDQKSYVDEAALRLVADTGATAEGFGAGVAAGMRMLRDIMPGVGLAEIEAAYHHRPRKADV